MQKYKKFFNDDAKNKKDYSIKIDINYLNVEIQQITNNIVLHHIILYDILLYDIILLYSQKI